MNGQTSVEKQLLAFLGENAYVSGELGPTTDLIETGALDSLLVTDLVLFVESSFGIGLNPGNISPKHFRNVECLARLIVEKLEKERKAA
ncbi:MAG: acyl carrier protein [Planctomycetota bacterium]